MNRSIPRTTLLIPPRLSWGRAATGLCSLVVRAWLSVAIGGQGSWWAAAVAVAAALCGLGP